VIKPGDIDAFVQDLKIEKIWGVGQVTAKKMHGLGLKTCGDIQKQSVYQLASWFGSRGEELFELSRGIDNRPVQAHRKSHSVSVEETYNKDLQTLAECLARVPELFESFEERMHRMKEPPKIRGFVVKLKFHDFKGTTHEISSRAWPTVADFTRLLAKAWERRGEPVRLIGIGVRLEAGPSKESGPQLSFTL
jgi:DNA polymerase-4